MSWFDKTLWNKEMYNYFGKTITEDKGYNIINTLIYVFLAITIYFYLIIPFLKRFVKEFNIHFVLNIILFVIIGAILRVFEEPYSTINLINRSINPLDLGFYFITPGIYFLIGVSIIILIMFTYVVSNHINQIKMLWFKTNWLNQNWQLTYFGTILFVPLFLYTLTKMSLPLTFFSYIIIVGLITIITYYFIKSPYTIKYTLNKFEFMALFAQTLDGFATFTALKYHGFAEQHIASNILIQTFGPFSFLIVKILLVLIVIYLLNKYEVNEDYKKYVLLFITIFGFATGFRDLLSIACQVII